MAQNRLTGEEVQGMVRHWVATPPNAYLGDDYGADPHALLQTPMAAGLADGFLGKMTKDIPVIGALPPGAVNIHLEDVPQRNDAKRLLIEVLDGVVALDGVSDER